MPPCVRSSFDIASVFEHDLHGEPGSALQYFVYLWSAFRRLEEI